MRTIHPLLIAVFPVLFLFSHNVNKVPLTEIAVPLIIVAGLTLLLLRLSILLVKDKEKSAIIVSIFLLLFFSYGHVLEAVNGLAIGKVVIGSYKHLIIIWTILFVSVSYLITRVRGNLHNLTKLLNVMAFSLLVISIVSGVFAYSWQAGINIKKETNLKKGAENFAVSRRQPDIYYIILDAYARGDVLEEIFQYDNTAFLDRLAQKGFYIADRSRANYPFTLPSLASSLNSEYLDDLTHNYNNAESDSVPDHVLKELINNNKTFHFLKQRGYKVIFLSANRYVGDVISTADIRISGPSWLPTEFQDELINTTPIPILLKVWTDFRYDRHRTRLLFFLDHLASITEKVRKDDSPAIVFAHFFALHVPFVLDENGEEIKAKKKFSLKALDYTKAEYIEKYKNQLVFINKMIEKAVDNILARSHEAPIIILQSDHGSASSFIGEKNITPQTINLKERMTVLNAYYLPDGGDKMLYRNITPVNSFRIIFNHYFAANIELLKDESYFSSGSDYSINVTDKVTATPSGLSDAED